MGYRILIADDDPSVREVIMEILSMNGNHIQSAANGQECLEALGRSTFDLLVLDLMMPKINGFEVVQSIRRAELHSGKHIPIVCISGHSEQAVKATCYRLGVDAFVSKPFSATVLMKQVGDLIGVAGGQAGTVESVGCVLNYEETVARFNGMKQVVKDLLELFRVESRDRMGRLLEARDQGNLSEVGRQAHTLKSISGTIGAMRLNQQSAELEKAVEKGNVEEISNLIRLVESSLKELEKRIQEVL